MNVNSINQTNFGTTCYIGDTSANIALKKYNKRLTSGILKAFKDLSNNNTNDTLSVIIGPTKGKDIKHLKKDVINLNYFDKNGTYQSSINLNPKQIEKRPSEEIKEIFKKIYKILTKTEFKAKSIISLPILTKEKKYKSKENRKTC